MDPSERKGEISLILRIFAVPNNLAGALHCILIWGRRTPSKKSQLRTCCDRQNVCWPNCPSCPSNGTQSSNSSHEPVLYIVTFVNFVFVFEC